MEDMLENREMLKGCDGSSEYGHSLAKGMENRKMMEGCGTLVHGYNGCGTLVQLVS